MFGRGARVRGGTIIMVGASSDLGMAAMGAGSAPMSCLWETGRPKLPSPLDVV
jgi:hypothetical protein